MFESINTLVDFLNRFSTDQACVDYLKELLWPDGVVSPYDSTSVVYNVGNDNYRCKNTGKEFNVKTRTIFYRTKVPLRKWFLAIYLSTSLKKGISSVQLAKELGVTQKTAWYMLHRIRQCCDIRSKAKFDTEVELDEAFVGGKNKNRRWDKKVKNSQGRSFKDKTPVFGMLERGGEVRASVVPNVTARTLAICTLKNISLRAKLYTDEWRGYDIVKKIYRYESVDHGKGQYVNGLATTNSIEGFWSLLKRGLMGIYHKTSRKHLQRYVNEFTFRYNTRNFTNGDRFDYFLRNAKHHLTYAQLVA